MRWTGNPGLFRSTQFNHVFLNAEDLFFFQLQSAAAAKSLQACPTLCDPIDGSPPGPCPWDSPGKNTGVGCHFLLQCMKVERESKVSQSCSTLRYPRDCSPPGSSVRGILQTRGLEWGAIAFSNDWPSSLTQNFQLIKRELMELLFVNTPVVFWGFLLCEQIRGHFFM